jgi:RNA polymerase sigma-70 factor (ECF subfamily)
MTQKSPGDSQSARELEKYRDYLQVFATRAIRPELRGKIAASDLVQETLWEAHRDRQRLDQSSVKDYRRWLRRILRNNLRDAERRFFTDKRAVSREVNLDRSSVLKQISSRKGIQPSPEDQEIAARLTAAISRLAPEHGEVIRLRNQQNLRYGEIARRLNLSEEAARKLWGRAVCQLRQLMAEPPPG